MILYCLEYLCKHFVNFLGYTYLYIIVNYNKYIAIKEWLTNFFSYYFNIPYMQSYLTMFLYSIKHCVYYYAGICLLSNNDNTS